jgi:hypothetical protein
VTAIRGARSAEGRYVQIRNGALQDDRLSFRARGVMAFVLSLPADTRVNSTELAKEAPEGRDAVRSALRELESFGYLMRVRLSGGRGKIGTETVITDDPDLLHGPGNPSPEKPPSGPIRGTGFQAPVRQSLTDKDGEKDEDGANPQNPSPTQIANTIARNACDAYPMQVFHKVRDATTRALKAGRNPNDVAAAVRRLCEQDKPVTAGSLQVELRGGFERPAPPLKPSEYDSHPASRGLDQVLW